MNNKPLILVKLGGSLITDKKIPFTEKLEVIKRLAKEIHEARSERKIKLLIGHGGGSYPHGPAKKYRLAEGYLNQESLRGFAETQDAAARLNRIVVSEFIKVGENAISINPSTNTICHEGKIASMEISPLLKALEFDMLPIVYGDAVFDNKKGICVVSTEKILNYLAEKLKSLGYHIENLVHYGITDGVYDRKGETILKITPQNFGTLKDQIGNSNGIDVTGGMLHKIEEALSLAKSGINSYIMNGFEQGHLKKLILGEKVPGTLIAPC